MPRGWIRIIATASTYLMLGAVINVAVAWACVCWSRLPVEARQYRGDWPVPVSDRNWPSLMEDCCAARQRLPEVPDGWPASVNRSERRGFGVTDIEATAGWPDSVEVGNRLEAWQLVFSSGWPARTLYNEKHGGCHRGGTGVLGEVSAPRHAMTPGPWSPPGIELPSWVPSALRAERTLPVRCYPAGLALNTVFYAMLCALIVAACRHVVRRRRVSRGLCPACAYPIGTSPVCTECGHALPVRDEAAVIPTMPSS